MSRLFLASLVGLFASSTAWAGRPAMDPEIKLHMGTSFVQGPSGLGLTGGMDSRLTRLIYVDMGVVASVMPLPLAHDIDVDGETPQDFFRLRHSIYVLPGLQVPHRQPKNFGWDLTFRAGPSVVWSADLSPNDPRTTPNTEAFLEIDVAAAAGLDLALMMEHVGIRGSARTFVLTPFYEEQWVDVLFWGPQFGVEAFYEF